jgi:predicted transcriptional regulator
MVRGLGELESTIMDHLWAIKAPGLGQKRAGAFPPGVEHRLHDRDDRDGQPPHTLVHFLERLTPEEASALESALQVYPPKGRSS